jgi:hypothetical protein
VQLGAVRLELILAGRDCRSGEVDKADVAVDESDALEVDLAVADVGLVKKGQRSPAPTE